MIDRGAAPSRASAIVELVGASSAGSVVDTIDVGEATDAVVAVVLLGAGAESSASTGAATVSRHAITIPGRPNFVGTQQSVEGVPVRRPGSPARSGGADGRRDGGRRRESVVGGERDCGRHVVALDEFERANRPGVDEVGAPGFDGRMQCRRSGDHE